MTNINHNKLCGFYYYIKLSRKKSLDSVKTKASINRLRTCEVIIFVSNQHLIMNLLRLIYFANFV